MQPPEFDFRSYPNSRHHGGHPEPPWQARGYEVEMRLFETDFSPLERDLIARAAGRVFDAAGIDSPAAGNARTGASRPSGYPNHPQEQDRAPDAPAAARGVEARI